jgi:hypothetical protein
MTFADMDCGIVEPHRHTGELVEGYHIEYWCPTVTAWVSERTRTSYGNKCTCETPHMKARIQHVMTEIIEILDPADYDVVEWIKRELKERFWCRLMEGDEAYERKYGSDPDFSIEHGFVRGGGDDTPKSGTEVVSEGDRSDPPEG